MKLHIPDTIAMYEQMQATANREDQEKTFREVFASFARSFVYGGQPQGEVLGTAKAMGFWLPETWDTEADTALEGLKAGNALQHFQQALEESVARFAPYQSAIALDNINAGLFLMKMPEGLPGEGATGFGGIPGTLMVVYSTPNLMNLARLPVIAAHEFHHNIRFTLFPWNAETTVADYIVAEGMAEAFGTVRYGDHLEGYYVTDHTEEQIARAKKVINAALNNTGDIRGYIFGDEIATQQPQFGITPVGVHRYAGYGVGYRLVRHYLTVTGKSIEEATFVPASEIASVEGFWEA